MITFKGIVKAYLIVVLLLICITCFYLFIYDEIKGYVYSLSYTPEKILLKQINGDGCGYRSECIFDYRYFSKSSVRSADYYCPMYAAKCMVRLKISSEELVSNLEKLLENKPPIIDTGDGIIKYGLCIESSIHQIRTRKFDVNEVEGC